MLFNSFNFFWFFIVITSLYFAIPYKYRWLLLLIGSCYFYMAFIPIYILILLYTITVDYFAAFYIHKSTGRRRKLYLVLSLIANIGALSIFKYYNFINNNLAFILNNIGYQDPLPYLKFILPIGLSFHTFQAMSYTIEVYRGNYEPEKNFGIYALYVMFYPQLVAGPIERPQNLIHQFREKFDFDYDRVTDGLRLMAWGLFQKVVIADRLTMVVDKVYSDPHAHSCLSLIISTFFFAFQIFCDFAGYSDIAIGAAMVMGFKLMKNFDKPYFSSSVSEFWKRWHISLSSWFRDYLYISIGGNKVTVPRWYLNIFIVFLVSGLWHGANWTFIIWGALNGFYIISGLILSKTKNKFLSVFSFLNIPILSKITTFTLITFSWIFFRAENVHSAFYIASHVITGLPDLFSKIINHQSLIMDLGVRKVDLIISFVLIGILESIHYLQKRIDVPKFIKKQPIYLRWSFYYICLFIILFMGIYDNHQFIYFQF